MESEWPRAWDGTPLSTVGDITVDDTEWLSFPTPQTTAGLGPTSQQAGMAGQPEWNDWRRANTQVIESGVHVCQQYDDHGPQPYGSTGTPQGKFVTARTTGVVRWT